MNKDDLQKLVADVAKRDLREDESTRRQALEQFRDWIEKNPDIRDCRTDDIFLLGFLRKGKFSVPMAQQMFLQLMNFMNNNPHITRNNDFMDPKTNFFMKNGFVYATPYRTKEGSRLIIYRCCRFDPYKCSYIDYIRASVTSCLTMLEDEANQVLGVTIIVDLAEATPARLSHMPISEKLALCQLIQNTFHLRFKGFHVINMLPVFKWIFDLIVSSLSSKMVKRFIAHKNVEDVYKHIDRKTLPKELGGEMPEQEMLDLWYRELESKREKVLLLDKIRVVTRINSNLKTNMAALPGAFRKLEVD